ncbi:hypothetical protein ACFOOP_04385 [Marinicaulis aureus]|uniref:Uncharacterized protein n=1 Tax=Hyphococcus aureus TaxID=2666033 RepID=A0ABW1KVB5_9PROT
MAKGQQRSNREAKKPKQNKPKKVEQAASQTTEVFHGKPKKKGGKN